jgi:hypothetical protein
MLTLGLSGFAAALPCDSGDIESKVIPDFRNWKLGEPLKEPSRFDRSWMRLALGFDWRIIDTKDFSYISVPHGPFYQYAFFSLRSDSGYCGSGGCSMDLEACTKNECETVWYGFQAKVYFTGALNDGLPDFVIDNADFYTFSRGKYRRVCNVVQK